MVRSEAGPYLTEILGDLEEVNRSVLQTMKDVAKNNSDHVRVKTSNKAWHARWTRRVADMLAKFRKELELESTAKTLTKLFLVAWDSPMPMSCGVCFRDAFLDENWNVATKSPQANCYLKVTYNFFWAAGAVRDSRLCWFAKGEENQIVLLRGRHRCCYL